MSIEVKQKIKDVADDFAMPAKKLIEIVGKFYEKPKSSSQNLSEDQLNVIVDYITQQNQIDSIEQVFAAAAQKKEAPAPAPVAAPVVEEVPVADDSELIAVISAAVAMMMEDGSAFTVRRVRRVQNAPAWQKAGREEQVYSRF